MKKVSKKLIAITSACVLIACGVLVTVVILTAPSPKADSGGSNTIVFPQISAGSQHTLALDNQGNLWAWGSNNSGELGLGDFGSGTNRQTPVQVNMASGINGGIDPFGGNTITQISAGDYHSLAIDNQGNIWAWGWNGNGQLGLGDYGVGTDRITPTLINTFPPGVSFEPPIVYPDFLEWIRMQLHAKK